MAGSEPQQQVHQLATLHTLLFPCTKSPLPFGRWPMTTQCQAAPVTILDSRAQPSRSTHPQSQQHNRHWMKHASKPIPYTLISACQWKAQQFKKYQRRDCEHYNEERPTAQLSQSSVSSSPKVEKILMTNPSSNNSVREATTRTEIIKGDIGNWNAAKSKKVC